jgi:hypothetical protein
MSDNYRGEMEKVRLYVASCVDERDLVRGLSVIDRYYRSCAWRSLWLNFGLLCVFSIPSILIMVFETSPDSATVAIILEFVIGTAMLTCDIARSHLNHEGLIWLWPRPPEPLAVAFTALWPGGAKVNLDARKIMCDRFGRRRCVPELRLKMANRI